MAKPLSCILITIQTEEGVTTKVVNESPFMIGRSLDTTIAIMQAGISRNHLLVKNKSGKVWIEDQGSSNGTSINDQKLEPKRLMPVLPTDRIRLGHKQEIQIQTIEVAFHQRAIDESQLNEEQRESVKSLLHGAHAEAARLVSVGKTIHDDLIRVGEKRLADFETNVVANRELIMAEVQKQAEQFIADAKTAANNLVLEASTRAAHEAQQMTARATQEVEQLTARATHEAQQITTRLQEECASDIAKQKEWARREAQHLLNEAKITGERQAKELGEATQARALAESEALMAQTRIKAKDEIERTLAAADDQVNKLRLEKVHAESDLKALIQRLEFEVSRLKSKAQSQQEIIDRRRKEWELESAKLKTAHELEIKTTTERERDRKIAEAHHTVEKMKMEFATQKRKIDEELSAAARALEVLKPGVASERQALAKLSSEVQALRSEAKALSEKTEVLKAESAESSSLHRRLSEEARDLENRRSALGANLSTLESQITKAKQDLEQQLAEGKSRLVQEMEKRKQSQDEELNTIHLVELERLKLERAQALQELLQERHRLGHKIMVAIEQAVVRHIPLEDWRKAAPEAEAEIQQHLSPKSIKAEADATGTPQLGQMVRQRQRERWVWLANGLIAGAAAMFLGANISQRILNDQDPMKSAAEEQSRQAKEDLERRRFNPPQDEEWRDTYAGCVIYTKDFADRYRDPEFQKLWLKTAQTYFLKQWKVEEESVVQTLSAVTTLVGTLVGRKQAIHPDYVNDGLRKMDDLEAETMARVKEILGSEVRIEAWQRLEKRTYTDFFAHRTPAGDVEESDEKE